MVLSDIMVKVKFGAISVEKQLGNINNLGFFFFPFDPKQPLKNFILRNEL